MSRTKDEAAAVLPTLLSALRLPSISRNWKHLTDTADRDGWPAANLLACLLEIEMAERASRRIQRHRKQSMPAAVVGHAFIDAGRGVLFSTTTDMVQKLQAARRELSLPSMLDKLDNYDLIVLDELSYGSRPVPCSSSSLTDTNDTPSPSPPTSLSPAGRTSFQTQAEQRPAFVVIRLPDGRLRNIRRSATDLSRAIDDDDEHRGISHRYVSTSSPRCLRLW